MANGARCGDSVGVTSIGLQALSFSANQARRKRRRLLPVVAGISHELFESCSQV
ncbi:hypothetical protein [Sporotomaculum syntrophicum]|uniref:hypothetical protein n=1 Tax=Sporotomaculum syntrophicum TaxID=182264 RepID=UPI001379C2C3|nr:hypothetical protein [Sporotomaculum syntrophicum]